MIGLKNSISDRLLDRILKGVSHAVWGLPQRPEGILRRGLYRLSEKYRYSRRTAPEYDKHGHFCESSKIIVYTISL